MVRSQHPQVHVKIKPGGLCHDSLQICFEVDFLDIYNGVNGVKASPRTHLNTLSSAFKKCWRILLDMQSKTPDYKRQPQQRHAHVVMLFACAGWRGGTLSPTGHLFAILGLPGNIK